MCNSMFGMIESKFLVNLSDFTSDVYFVRPFDTKCTPWRRSLLNTINKSKNQVLRYQKSSMCSRRRPILSWYISKPLSQCLWFDKKSILTYCLPNTRDSFKRPSKSLIYLRLSKITQCRYDFSYIFNFRENFRNLKAWSWLSMCLLFNFFFNFILSYEFLA